MSIPKSTQEFKEIVYNKMMPESLTKPCVVRCKVNICAGGGGGDNNTGALLLFHP